MAVNDGSRRTRLSIDIEPELQQRIQKAAADQNMSIHDYVAAALRQVLTEGQHAHDAGESVNWTHLSTASFARDWESEEDQAYDRLA